MWGRLLWSDRTGLHPQQQWNLNMRQSTPSFAVSPVSNCSPSRSRKLLNYRIDLAQPTFDVGNSVGRNLSPPRKRRVLPLSIADVAAPRSPT
jgi:hypothetical protein